jgi:anti-sigma factor ChrR (cupin superfamily)
LTRWMEMRGIQEDKQQLGPYYDCSASGSEPSLLAKVRRGILRQETTTTAPTKQGVAEPTVGGSTYLKPQEMAWEPTQFDGISIKILYQDKEKGEMTCFLKWEPGATLPMHKHPEIEQTFVLEGSFYDHDGICRAGEFVWRRVGSFHETHSDEGAVILAIYRKPNIFQHSAGYTRKTA